MTDTGVISSVHVRGIGNVAREFLSQFGGRDAQDSFDLAHTPEDLLYIPVKIKAMNENPTLSASIAQSVKEIVTSAGRVIK